MLYHSFQGYLGTKQLGVYSMVSVANPSLEAGESALNEGKYPEAIAHLEGICEIEIDEEIVSRAQKALVVAYSKSDNLDKAIALCENLSLLETEKVWTAKVLPNLYKQKLGKPGNRNKSQKSGTILTEAVDYQPGRQWRNGGRAKNWKPFKKPKLRQIWFGQIIAAYGLFWLLSSLVQFFLETTNQILVTIPYTQPIQLFYQDPQFAIAIFLISLLIASPWLLDLLLEKFYSLKTLRLTKLTSQRPETAKTLQKFCRQRKIPLPKLGILPTHTPIAFTYGNLRRNACIVISQGLLEQLSDEELATIYGTQAAYLYHWHFIVMSGVMAVLQLAYTLYWQIALGGEKIYKQLQSRKNQPPKYIHPLLWQKIPPVILGTATILSALFYGMYWLLRLPTLWLSRIKVYYGDRLAVEITGNPNALTRALLKITIGIAHQVQENRHTGWLLESFDICTPISHRQALSLGSLPDYTPLESIMAWDCVNPYRHWLKFTNSHPLLGERIYLLSRYAYFWKLQPELDLPTLASPAKGNKAKFLKALYSYRALPILHSAVLSGLVLGGMVRLTLWGIGIVSNYLGEYFGLWRLIWLYNGQPKPLISACVLATFSLCIIVWINGYFPDITNLATRKETKIANLLANQDSLPPHSERVRLTGKLLGRQGISNSLAQDLILQTDTGLIKLHFYDGWSWFHFLFPHKLTPQDALNQKVTIKGWFRRGGTPWIDVDTIRLETGKSLTTIYPFLVTGLALVAAVSAAYLILQV